MMKRITIGLVGLLTSFNAFAADLGPSVSVKAKPAPAPVAETPSFFSAPVSDAASVYNRFGCYVDAGLALGVTTSKLSLDDANKLPLSPQGFLGSLGGGCDVPVASKILLGAWATYNLGDMETKFTTLGDDLSFKVSNTFAIGGRLGYMVQPTTMLFGRLGYASGEGKFSVGSEEIASRNLNAVVLGIGVETALFANTALRLQLDDYRWQDTKVDGAKLTADTFIVSSALVFRF